MGGRPEGHARLVSRLEEVLEGLIGRRNVEHALVAVEAGDRSFGWSGARGIATPEGQPLEVDDLVPLASVTKLYTSVLVHQLAEAALIDLDDPITNYLDDLAGLHRSDGVDLTDRITVRHLLSHTSGLPDYYLDKPNGGVNLHERIVRDGDRSFDLAEVVEVVRELQPHFAPRDLSGGGKATPRYADTNFQLLGGIIAEVTGTSFEDALSERLLVPAGLGRTFARRQVPEGEQVAGIWVGVDYLDVPKALASLGPDGGLVASAGDAMRFARRLYSGELFEREQTLPGMQEPWLRFGFPRDRTSLMAPSWPIQSGVGMLRFQAPLLLNGPRRVPAVIGQTGATGSWLWHCPELDVTTFGTVGQVTAAGEPYRIVPRLLRPMAERARTLGH